MLFFFFFLFFFFLSVAESIFLIPGRRLRNNLLDKLLILNPPILILIKPAKETDHFVFARDYSIALEHNFQFLVTDDSILIKIQGGESLVKVEHRP